MKYSTCGHVKLSYCYQRFRTHREGAVANPGL